MGPLSMPVAVRARSGLHSVAVTRDAIVAPADVRSIAMIRSRLVADRAGDLDDAGADRLGDAGLAVFRAIGRVGLVLRSAMGSSRLVRRHPPHHLSPTQASTRQGKPPKRAIAAPSHHSNALFRQESQSILSKIVAICALIRFRAKDSQLSPPPIDNTDFGDGTKYRQHAARPIQQSHQVRR
jgi:hypothetical protein